MSEKYTYNRQCLLRDGKPWFPVMGEMHYSRYRQDLWEESLRKIKAGGVTVVSTYVIWIHHEEEQGVFDFTGCRDLRKFVQLCREVGLKMFLRIGPWVHGEVRNGGFPDWVVELAKDGVDLRSNDPAYMSHVRRYWEQIYRQVQGLLSEDGGPVIGLQLENEYGHVGGYGGEKGEAHMRTLLALAKELGFKVPLYTATGWGGACIGDALPVMGGYCDAPWDQSTGELPANANYVISHVRNDALIACDHHVEGAVTFDETKFPYLTAELGGGLQVTSHRRPVATGPDIGAMSLTKLASGVALLGYYMYHGGSNPQGRLSTLQESRDTGYANDLPRINYDFNAPIRQYGAISDNYREIKLLASFLQDYGEDLAPLAADIDGENSRPEDVHTLRSSCRHDARHGYVFFNNYQRRRVMDCHKAVVFRGPCEDGDVYFPAVDIPSGAYGFFPYNMKLGETVLLCALATPFCRLRGGDRDTYVFYGDHAPCYRWRDGIAADILHLTRAQALNAWKITLEQDYLVLCDNYVWEQEGELAVTGGPHTEIALFPEPLQTPAGFEKTGTQGRFTLYSRTADADAARAEIVQIGQDGDCAVYEITVEYPGRRQRLTGRDTILTLTYAGFGMEIYLGDYRDSKMINDHFYTGQQVPISLGYFDFPRKLSVIVKALREGDRVYIEKWPALTDGVACRLEAAEIREEYR